jgi:cytochrome c nitrite reductase small subunit
MMRVVFKWVWRWRAVLSSFVLGGLAAVGASLATVHMVEETGDDEFCGACHEMDIFCETWREGSHGTAELGIEVAKCVDCHLPHTGTVPYLIAKGRTGMHDTIAHIRGYEPDWVENLEHREAYVYESGCRECHKELIAPGISLKAYNAHRDVITGETTKTCIACHSEVGHGDLKSALMKREH